MEVKTHHIEQLLLLLSTKTKKPLDYKGFGEISSAINDNIGQKYLYENLHLKCKTAKENNDESISLQATKLDRIAKFLQYDSFGDLVQKWETPLNKILLSCIGNYYNYVRRNAVSGVVLQSPVTIKEQDGKVWFELKGPKWTYRGELILRNGCLFVLMQAQGGKCIHHVYKVGTREKPEVLQGIFSGVSTVFEPIGGRTVLIRTDDRIVLMKNQEIEIQSLKKSKDIQSKRLAEYFLLYETNNLSINKVVTFTTDDLRKS